jgi:hypothetical protein
MIEFEIWVEGYAENGESSKGQFIGRSSGETFLEAIKICHWPNGDKIELDSEDPPQTLACRLYHNEANGRIF